MFTFIAQIINFIILVLLLRYFLYKRIVRVMDQREKMIASKIKDAEESKKEADKRKKDLIQKARNEVDSKQKHWYESLQKHKESFLDDLRMRTSERVFIAIRNVLKDLADEKLEEHIIRIFLKSIEDLDKEEKEEFNQSLVQSDHSAKIRSRFELSKDMRQKIEKTIKDTFSKETRLEFNISDDVIGGIELESNERKIGWNIESYLSDLEENIAEAFEQKSSSLIHS